MTAPVAGRVLVETVARCLGPLREEVAFLGGAATSLLLSDPAAPEIRSTIDVDVIVEVASRIEYYRLAERLRALGFREVAEEGAPVCRWRVAGVLVDVMPTLPEVLGFSNRWYSEALATASVYRMAEDLVIRLVTPPYFLATKVEAFRSRGGGDYRASHDLEDIIAVLDGRPEVVSEIAGSKADLRQFLRDAFASFLSERAFLEAVPGHLPPDAASQARTPIVLERAREVATLAP
ncbi:MAG: hypothetical protein SCH98_01135 [Deferrisomatales bacterium]|nr:hypothetical protein [Deferrisomatales bacterium]